MYNRGLWLQLSFDAILREYGAVRHESHCFMQISQRHKSQSIEEFNTITNHGNGPRQLRGVAGRGMSSVRHLPNLPSAVTPR